MTEDLDKIFEGYNLEGLNQKSMGAYLFLNYSTNMHISFASGVAGDPNKMRKALLPHDEETDKYYTHDPIYELHKLAENHFQAPAVAEMYLESHPLKTEELERIDLLMADKRIPYGCLFRLQKMAENDELEEIKPEDFPD